MPRDFQRLAIVNRGEPAMRLIHAVRELNSESSDKPAIRIIALYTEPDRHAMFVREADESVCLGAATFLDERDGQRKNAYLSYSGLERALVQVQAEAVWVGWGFVSEQPDFVALCERLGIVFIGPPSQVMRQLGDKIAAKRLAEKVGVPVAPWSKGPVATIEEAREYAARIGFPLMIKATSGGGGRGIRRVENAAELAEAFERARGEALRAFGDDTVFMERLVCGARHIEVQIIADTHGNTWAAGVRDCSIQRRNQKVLEEAPSPVLSRDHDLWLRQTAVRLCQAADYSGAGTVEFLYDPVARSFSFMEVNARLQVEHPVTEATTGLDLVKLQLHVARGGRLEGSPPEPHGHAIEVRINAEDAEHGFSPAPGNLTLLRLPTGPGIRVDTGVREGDRVPAEFDSMIAKLIASGRDRGEALARLRRAIAETVILVNGGTTNKSFLYGLLAQPAIESGAADTAWLDRNAALLITKKHAEVAVIAAAIESYESEWAREQEEFFASAARGRPHARTECGHVTELRTGGRTQRLGVFRLSAGRYRIDADGVTIEVADERMGTYERWLAIGSKRYRIISAADGAGYRVEVDGIEHQIMREDPGLVRAPIPAVVLATLVRPGDEVAAGARLIVLEAMKMEVPVLAPFAGRVGKIEVASNVQVPAGAPLLVLEPLAAVAPAAPAEPLHFATLAAAAEPAARLPHTRQMLRALFLGFDIAPSAAKGVFTEYRRLCQTLAQEDATRWSGEEELVSIFADLCSLVRRLPGYDDPEALQASHSEEYLFTYLRSPDHRGRGLPASFLGNLRQVLTHHGVSDLDPTPALRESLLRVFKAQRCLDAQSMLVFSILESWLQHTEQLRSLAQPTLRALLQRLTHVTHGRHQALCDLSREVLYRYFDQPLFEAVRDRTYAEMDAHLSHLHEHPQAPDREARIAALVECPQPLVTVLARRFPSAPPALTDLMLEVLTRRYYRIRPLSFLGCRALSRQRCAVGEYYFEGKRIHCLAVYADYAQFAESMRACRAVLSELPVEDDVVMDFYLVRPDALAPAETTQAELARAIQDAVPPRLVRRIVTVVAGPGGGRGIASVQHFTYRPSAGGYVEDKLCRGLHPMMGKRLHLWQLSNFEIERLPSTEDVYLFRAVARDNAKDRRLFACAEVRSLAAVRDATGRVLRLPDLDHMLMEALGGMRSHLFQLAPEERPTWNRVLLFIWPPLDLRPDELDDIIHRLAPLTEGLGIEQVMVQARIPQPDRSGYTDSVIHISNPGGTGLRITSGPPPKHPLRSLSEYDQKVARMSQRGLTYPYELVRMLTAARDVAYSEFPPGEFVEYDLDAAGALVPIKRPMGSNTANIVVGLIKNYGPRHAEGMTRVLLVGDPSRAMGALAQPECLRIMRAIDLAARLGVPIEWFALSAGAKISLDSGTENMDEIAAVLRRIIEFTQAGGEINLVVNGINVGAQPYWNAEATMLMHTRGVLIMTPQGAMVLTGKQALDYSGSISAEDNQGIGGYERIMGPNGQAQYWARDLTEAIHTLFRHYDHTYVVPGERFPRPTATSDPRDRDFGQVPLDPESGFGCIGEIFSADKNPGRKLPFDIRKVMAAAIDQDLPPLERWAGMRDAEIAVVWDAHLGGHAVCLIGFEAQSLPRLGHTPADGPDHFTAGTLFPRASKKVARAINAASGNRPVVLLANLSGFDGSPESLRELQLEFGAEIGRSVVNFKGPMVFCVVSRYHGGAYVVFSSRLNEGLEVAALEGSYASVIGGVPAAAVVFAGEVEKRTQKDPRVAALTAALSMASDGSERARLRVQLDEVYAAVHSQKLGEAAEAFDKIHSVERALSVGSLHHIIPAVRLRPYLIEAVERGVAKTLGRATAG